MNQEQQLAEFDEAAVEDFSNLSVKDFHKELDKLRDLKIDYVEKNKAKKAAEGLMKAQIRRVREIADQLGIRGRVNTQKGAHTYEIPEPTWYAVVQDFGAFEAWAEKNAPGLIRVDKRVSAGMNSLVRRRREDRRPLPPGLGALPREPVKVFGVKDEDEE